MTNLADATRRAVTALGETQPGRRPVLLILSDGYPTTPGSERNAARESRQIADIINNARLIVGRSGKSETDRCGRFAQFLYKA